MAKINLSAMSDRIVLCGLNARYMHTSLALRDLAAMVRLHWPEEPEPELVLREWTINDQELMILSRLYRERAAVYAFSCYVWNWNLVRLISRSLKKVCPDAWIIWGGPEMSGDTAEIMRAEPEVDLIISGEGEPAFLHTLQVLYKTRQPRPASLDEHLADIANLTWRDRSGSVRINPAGPLLAGDGWPFPYTDGDLAAHKEQILYYEAARGCPFHCSYCLSALDKTVRCRPLPLVFAELKRFLAADVRQVKFVDRTFNCQKERALAIWRFLTDQWQAGPFRTNFHFEIAGDLLDDEAVAVLAVAPPGLFQLEIGVQTIQPAVLQAINRSCRLDILQRRIAAVRRPGNIHIHLDLIAGLPGERFDEFGRSFDWVYRLNPHTLQLGFLKILPGAPMQETARERHFLWQEEPPYEILQSDGLDYGELMTLKQIEQVLDLYDNSGQFSRSVTWLAGRWPRPFLFYQKMAAWFDQAGCLDRALGYGERAQLLWTFGCAETPELRNDSWLAGAWLDLLRIDYVAGGQKDRPAWLHFWEDDPDPAARERFVTIKQAYLQRRSDKRRIRIDRLSFNWLHYNKTGELKPGNWVVIEDLSGYHPVLADAWPDPG
ncbi:MAG: DUF4080 domain-containing protein [Clostridiaceae bacterium]|nr:DUF4080 domain-containing protein [Clostridiaceae bacterium]